MNEVQRNAFAKLPKNFRYKDAQNALGGKSSANTTNFIDLCIRMELVRRLSREDGYVKLLE